jgi:CO/xanthine dehydrogenase FAD-binding subunit
MERIADALSPGSLAEALEMLSRDGGRGTIPIAGGTNVVVAIREGMHWGKALIDVSRLDELGGVRREGDEMVVGGATTLATVLESELIAQHGRPLHQAARVFANPLVRNRATVAGNLVDASPAADTAPALLVLGAEAELASAAGNRRVPLDQFFLGPNQTVRRPDELLVAVRWPVPSLRSAGAFQKLALRKGTACSVLGVAVMIAVDDDGTIARARIALGAAAPRPVRARAAEEALVEGHLTGTVIHAAAQLASEAAEPIDDVRSTGDYRRRMVSVLTRRLLTQVKGELEGGGWE